MEEQEEEEAEVEEEEEEEEGWREEQDPSPTSSHWRAGTSRNWDRNRIRMKTGL